MSFSAAATRRLRSAAISVRSGSLPNTSIARRSNWGPEHLRRYQRYLLQEKKLEPSTVEIRISALRFLYRRTLKRSDLVFDDLIFPKVPHKLPTVLSQDEVVRLI
jgi:site-specific recombinase XerD